jgi:hypothetical protein
MRAISEQHAWRVIKKEAATGRPDHTSRTSPFAIQSAASSSDTLIVWPWAKRSLRSGLGETTATTAIASSTYAAPTPAYDPSTPADIVVNSLFGLASPKVRSLQLQISNNLQQQYAFGSADPFAIGLGEFNVQGVVEVYFNALADYSAFVVKQTGQTFDITIGATMNFKDRLVLGNCDVFNPNVDDPGQTGVHAVTLNFLGKYYATDASAMKLTRNVP